MFNGRERVEGVLGVEVIREVPQLAVRVSGEQNEGLPRGFVHEGDGL